jgi:hypothetical protein
MAENNEDIKIIAPPTILTLLPVAMTVGALYYFRKQGKGWMQTILLSGGVAVLSSMPTWIYAYNVNKQYRLQTQKPKEETTTETK